MRRRIAATGLLLCALGAGLSARAPALEPRPPNVVLIVSDDQAWTDFGFMGHPVIRTPNLDRLASESAVFPNGYVPTSLCRASLASIITGLYGFQHRICCNDPPEGVDRAAMLRFIREAPSLPRLLRARGYRSLQTGKWWEGHYSNGGFTHGMTTRGRHGEEGLVIGRQTMQPIYDFVEQSGEQPFFVWYAPMMPHEPHNPPPRLLAKYEKDASGGARHPALARYYAMCEWFDETVGALLEFLDRRGLRERTLVGFVVDNGWIQETGGVRRTRGNFAPRSKLSPYEGGIRTPVMLRWPGRIVPGRREDLVSTVDLAPTLLAAAGLPRGPGMQGENLLPTAEGRGPLRRTAVLGEMYVHTAVSLDRPRLNLTYRWVREGEWKLIEPVLDQGPPELYRVALDPNEERNLAPAEPERVRHLLRRIAGWWRPL